jgi:outer membrane protein
MHKASIFPLLLTFLATAFCAVHAATDTPLSIYRLAEKNDAEIRAAYASLRAEREKMNQSTGALFPQISLTGEIAANREDVDVDPGGTGTSGEQAFKSSELGLTIRQPVFRKELFTDLDITEANIYAAEFKYKVAQQDLISRVLDKFFKSLAARDNLEFLIAERKAIKEQLDYTKKRYKVGRTTKSDFFEAQAAFDLANAEVIAAQDLLKDSLDAIEEMTGTPPKKLAQLGNKFSPKKPDPINVEHWIKQAEKNNPALIEARYQVVSSRYELDRFKARHYPKLDIIARYKTQETGGRFGDSTVDDTSVGLRLEIPIYSGGQDSSRVRESLERLQETRDKLLGTQRAVIRETNKVYRNTVTAINRIKALEIAVKSTRAAVKYIRAGFKAGTRTNADILLAQSKLFRAKQEHSAAKYSYMANYFQLKNMTGNLTKADVELINAWFDQ